MADTDTVKLTTPEIRVLMSDLSTWEIQTANPDLIHWDRMRARQKWPQVSEAPFLWLTFVAWSASKRKGLTQLDFQAFADQCDQITNLHADDDDEADDDGTRVAIPTLPGLGPG